jgi:DNA processing protein
VRAQLHGFGADDEPLVEEPADIAALLTTAPVGVDDLVRQSGANAGSVHLALLELEIAGRLVRHAGGRVSLDRGWRRPDRRPSEFGAMLELM